MSSLIHFLNLAALQHYWRSRAYASWAGGTKRPIRSCPDRETDRKEPASDQPGPLHRREAPRLATILGLMLPFGFAVPACAHAQHDTIACERETQTMDIPSMSLSRAVQTFIHQTGCPVLVDPTLLAGRNAVAVNGSFTPRDALAHLFGAAHVDVTATISGLSVSPIDAQALASGSPLHDSDDKTVATSRMLPGVSQARLNDGAAKPQHPISSREPA
ncbi:STN domain-containing protein [Gluconacetobacter takamatsuzukensis]|uniref:STN domain-containing protein n=1 Tax=Gluconacetobacter takamatsuzukensis TaxID=1286190 RepID=UPI001FEA77EC|nr:STN domain-containing protein [Gluconacetobacter takamatsuzukensis]